MRRAGFTLIEAMITVASVAIVGVALASGVRAVRGHATILLQRERALQVLEYEAGLRLRGSSGEEETRARLLELLPGGRYERLRVPGGETLTVTWGADGRVFRRELFLAGGT